MYRDTCNTRARRSISSGLWRAGRNAEAGGCLYGCSMVCVTTPGLKSFGHSWCKVLPSRRKRPCWLPCPPTPNWPVKHFLLAANPDTVWKGFGGRFTPDEQILASRNFGLTSEREMKQETVFIDHADTDTGREKLRALKVRQFNCLVFNISDDNLHIERGDLREINDKIRQKVERDVLPEMKRLVGPDDVVVITSDHGFVELVDQDSIPIDAPG